MSTQRDHFPLLVSLPPVAQCLGNWLPQMTLPHCVCAHRAPLPLTYTTHTSILTMAFLPFSLFLSLLSALQRESVHRTVHGLTFIGLHL